MHAVMFRVTIHDREQAEGFLKEHLVPQISQAPGFVAGYWTNVGEGQGASMVVFESEDAANQAANVETPPPEEAVTIESIEVGEVVVTDYRDAGLAAMGPVLRSSGAADTPARGCRLQPVPTRVEIEPDHGGEGAECSGFQLQPAPPRPPNQKYSFHAHPPFKGVRRSRLPLATQLTMESGDQGSSFWVQKPSRRPD